MLQLPWHRFEEAARRLGLVEIWGWFYHIRPCSLERGSLDLGSVPVGEHSPQRRPSRNKSWDDPSTHLMVDASQPLSLSPPPTHTHPPGAYPTGPIEQPQCRKWWLHLGPPVWASSQRKKLVPSLLTVAGGCPACQGRHSGEPSLWCHPPRRLVGTSRQGDDSGLLSHWRAWLLMPVRLDRTQDVGLPSLFSASVPPPLPSPCGAGALDPFLLLPLPLPWPWPPLSLTWVAAAAPDLFTRCLTCLFPASLSTLPGMDPSIDLLGGLSCHSFLL